MFSRLLPFLPTALFTLGIVYFGAHALTGERALGIVYFGAHALTGERGLLGWEQREALLAQRQTELKRVVAERADLEARADLLRDDHLSADLLEERARVLLGFADPRDYVIRIKQG